VDGEATLAVGIGKADIRLNRQVGLELQVELALDDVGG
jgi:hypothetical protein